MRTTIQADKLKNLFQAYRDRNDSAFFKIAENIISDELAANHFHAATALQQALGKGRGGLMSNGVKITELMPVPPKDRRNGEDLLWLTDTPVSPVVFFSPEAEMKVARVLEEQRSGNALRKHGYAPKSKLLFWGPPGCGKTLTAQYIAAELGLPLATVRLSAVISSFLGDTAAHLQRILSRANSAPMVLLLDEADALAKNRDDPNDVGELKRVVNSFLQALDSFSSPRSVLIAASNHQYLLDPALWRRFDDVVEFSLPELRQRQGYLAHLLSGVRVEGSLQEVARKMTAMSYSDIEKLTIDAVKTMILRREDTFRAQCLLMELQAWKRSIQKAKKRNGAKSK